MIYVVCHGLIVYNFTENLSLLRVVPLLVREPQTQYPEYGGAIEKLVSNLRLSFV